MSRVGAVVIGRNEAHNLARCLASVVGHVSAVVFVDSGSTDGSADVARRFGVDVVELEAPFTVARARNAGFERLLRLDPELRFVQFVDGDSEIVPSWFHAGGAALSAEPERAAVFGRWRERQPRRSIYARTYQIESNQRAGEPQLPGMAMLRVDAFQQVGGFEPTLQALEDHELQLRLRRARWRISYIDEEMAVHEAGIDNWRAWWRRRVRGGYGVAQGIALHGGSSPERFAVRRMFSIWVWGGLLPATIIAATVVFGAPALLLLGAYPIFIANICRRLRLRGFEGADAAAYALLSCLAKFPEAVGQAQFWLRRATVSRSSARRDR